MSSPLEIARQRLQTSTPPTQTPIEVARQRLRQSPVAARQGGLETSTVTGRGTTVFTDPDAPKMDLVKAKQTLTERGIENLKFGIKEGSPIASIIGGTEVVGGAVGNVLDVVFKPAEIANNFIKDAGNKLGELIAGTEFGGAIREKVQKRFEPGLQKGFDSIQNFINEKSQALGVAEKVQAIKDTFDKLPPEAQKFIKEVPDIGESLLNIGILFSGGTAKGKKPATAVEAPIVGKAGAAVEKSGIKAEKAARQKFVRELIKPTQTSKVKEAQVARTTETGRGIFKRSLIEPTKAELAAEKAVIPIKGVKPSNTFQQNFNVIQAKNKIAAEKLKTAIKKNDFIFPKKELSKRLKQTRAELDKTLVGDAQKQADKLIKEITRRVDAAGAKGSELLQVRKDFDVWVKSQKGKGVFDPARENAFTIANRDIRRTLNTFLDEKATSVAVKKSLANQSSLFKAMDNLTSKAAVEADTAFRRFFQRADKVLGTKNKIVQATAAAVGIGGLGAAATFAPAAAAGAGAGFALFKAGKAIASPKVRKALGIFLKGVDKAIPQAISAKKAILIELKDEAKKLLEDHGSK